MWSFRFDGGGSEGDAIFLRLHVLWTCASGMLFVAWMHHREFELELDIYGSSDNFVKE